MCLSCPLPQFCIRNPGSELTKLEFSWWERQREPRKGCDHNILIIFFPHHSRIKSIFPPWISSVLKYLISKGGGGRTSWKDRHTSEKRNPSLWLGISAKWAERPGFFLTIHATRCKRIYLLSKIFPYYILSNFPLKTNSACQRAPRVPQARAARAGPSQSSFLFFQEKKPDSLFLLLSFYLDLLNATAQLSFERDRQK